MHYVYIIVSVAQPERYYVGLTENVRQRLGHHNQGIVRSTGPFKPWRLWTAICFSSKDRAAEFEQYLKTGSGIAFLRSVFFSFKRGPVNLLALRLQWFESTPTQTSPRAILQVFKPFDEQIGHFICSERYQAILNL